MLIEYDLDDKLCINIDGVLVPVEAVSIPQENIIIRRN